VAKQLLNKVTVSSQNKEDKKTFDHKEKKNQLQCIKKRFLLGNHLPELKEMAL
jgi:hypothetical protein